MPDRDSNSGALSYHASTRARRSEPCRYQQDETITLLLAVRARTHTEPPNVTGEGGSTRPDGIQTQDLSHTVRARPAFYNRIAIVCLFVLRFYCPVNPMGACRAWSVYLTTRLLGRLSPLSH